MSVAVGWMMSVNQKGDGIWVVGSGNGVVRGSLLLGAWRGTRIPRVHTGKKVRREGPTQSR